MSLSRATPPRARLLPLSAIRLLQWEHLIFKTTRPASLRASRRKRLIWFNKPLLEVEAEAPLGLTWQNPKPAVRVLQTGNPVRSGRIQSLQIEDVEYIESNPQRNALANLERLANRRIHVPVERAWKIL